MEKAIDASRSTIMFDFLYDFRIFEIRRFEAIFRVVDRGNHSHQLLGAFERLGGSSGAQSPPDFATFLVRMLVGFCVDFRAL